MQTYRCEALGTEELFINCLIYVLVEIVDQVCFQMTVPLEYPPIHLLTPYPGRLIWFLRTVI